MYLYSDVGSSLGDCIVIDLYLGHRVLFQCIALGVWIEFDFISSLAS